MPIFSLKTKNLYQTFILLQQNNSWRKPANLLCERNLSEVSFSCVVNQQKIVRESWPFINSKERLKPFLLINKKKKGRFPPKGEPARNRQFTVGQIFDTPLGVSSDVSLCFSTRKAKSICFAVISEGDDYIVFGRFVGLAVDTVLAHQKRIQSEGS